VYIFGHRALAPLARERAALLACGAGAVISHFSAARMWQLVNGSDDDPIHVTVARRLVRSRDHIRVHHCSQLKAGEVRRIDGLPLTAPIRTILDLAAVGHPQLERVLSEAHARSLIGSRDLTQLHELGRGRRGAQGLRMLLELERSGYTRSKAERLLRSVVRQAQLPQPLTNLRLAGYEVDFFWPTQKLVVEVDGYAFHGHRRAFERDRRKDAALVAAGYRVIRITWLQLTNEPFAVAAILASALTAARDRG
jgi:very-short-patch-repair endonuclease